MERLDLKRLRKDAEITQSELANRIGYPQAFLSQIEHGKRPAPDKLIKIVVKELGISNINDYIETVPDPVLRKICLNWSRSLLTTSSRASLTWNRCRTLFPNWWICL